MKGYSELSPSGRIGVCCAMLLGITIGLLITAMIILVVIVQGHAIPDMILLT